MPAKLIVRSSLGLEALARLGGVVMFQIILGDPVNRIVFDSWEIPKLHKVISLIIAIFLLNSLSRH